MHRLSTPWLILVGLCLSALGVFFNFLLERHSYHMAGVDSEFFFLEYTFLPTLALGLLATLAGSLIWAWRTSVSVVGVSGIVITVLALLAVKFTPINFHGWTGSLMFLYLAFLFVGALFFIFAAVRFASSRLAMRRK